MKVKRTSSTVVTALALAILGSQAKADDRNQFVATFSGFQEVGALNAETGAIFSQGQGSLTLKVDLGNRLINYQLTYSGLSSNILQSHIHFGKRRAGSWCSSAVILAMVRQELRCVRILAEQ
jgi:hypothetical protein